MTSETPRASRADNLRFTAVQTVPQLLRGMFTRRPRLSALIDLRHPDPQGVRLVRRLRERYGSDYIWLSMGGKPTLLVLDPEGIRHVLDASPDVYGPPDLKVKGMSHFQPGALTVSAGEEWKRRRAFHDEVMGAGEGVPPRAEELLGVVAHHLRTLVEADVRRITWRDLKAAFREITSAVVFGADVDAESVVATLDRLMKRANRVVGTGDTPGRAAFHDDIRRLVRDPEVGGLAAGACPHMGQDDPLPVATQIPHWLFALKDTLATNCANALALVAAHPPVQDRAMAEVAAADLADPGSVAGLAWVEGCLRDTMRLWPTTPLLLRKVLLDDEVGGHAVPAGSQVVIHNGFNHRNPEAMTDPEAFHPEAWQQGVWDYRFNHLSNGPQACAGSDLVHFLGTAVLAHLLRAGPWTLREPVLDPQRPIPHAFAYQSLLLTG